MKKFLMFIVAFLVSALTLEAQTTTVSATVVDSDSTVWSNGNWSIAFVPNPSFPSLGQYNINGTPLSPSVTSQTGTSNGSGVLSVVLYTSATITPQGSSWRLTMCPKASSACGSTIFQATGTTQDISSSINSAITAPRFNAIAGSFGYADVEAQMTIPIGGAYYNVVSLCQRYYNGSAWSCGSGSGGSGTVSSCSTAQAIAWYAVTGTTVGCDPNLIDNGAAFTYGGTSGISAIGYSATGASNGFENFTFTNTPASAPTTNQYQISPAQALTNPQSWSPDPNPSTGCAYDTVTTTAGVNYLVRSHVNCGGLTGGTVNQPIVATGATTIASVPGPLKVSANTIGSDFCAKLSTVITQAGGSHAIIDATAFSGVQSCGSNPLSAVSSGAAALVIYMPCQVINTTAAWSYTSGNGVHIYGCGEDGNSVLQATTGFPASTPLLTFGNSGGLNSYNRIEDWRLNANGVATGTLYSVINGQEGDGAYHVNFAGSDSSTTTADEAICTNCFNTLWLDDTFSNFGLNHGLTFNTTSTTSTESNLVVRSTFNNNTAGGHHAGLAGLYFAATSFMSWSEAIQTHAEGSPYGIEIGANNNVGVFGLDTTGSITTSSLRIDSGGTNCGGVQAVGGIRDGGSATNLVDDECPSTPVLITTTANPFGAHSAILQYPLPSAGTTTTVASGTLALATSAITSATCQAITAGSVNSAAATGVLATDSIIWSPNVSIQGVSGYAVSTTGALSIDDYPTSGFVNFNVCNWTSGTLTPGALTLNWKVVR
jgi:hypothetical protein